MPSAGSTGGNNIVSSGEVAIHALRVFLIATMAVVAGIAVVRSRQSEPRAALEEAPEAVPALVPLDLDGIRSAGF
jgi:hypothetical protein